MEYGSETPVSEHCRQRLNRLDNELHHLFASGEKFPFLLHYFIALLAWPTLTLLVSRQFGSYAQCIRILGFVGTVAQASWMVTTCRISTYGNGQFFGVPIGCFVLKSAVILFLVDPEKDFMRIEQSTRECIPSPDNPTNTRNVAAVSDKKHSEKNRPLRSETTTLCPETQTCLIWQPWPKSFKHRVYWTIELMLSLRGTRWSWRSRSMTPKMGEALCSKSRQQPHEVIHGHEVDLSLETARRRLKALILNAVFEYILLDLCIVLAGYDPYFSGAGTAISPVIETLPFIFFFARAYRVILCLIMFRCFMTIGCTIGQAITLGLSITFRQSAQVFTSAPLIAEWLYPDILGSMQVVADQGLVGFWGSYWHQLLRFSLTSCSRFVLSLIPEKLRRFQIVRVLLMAIVPFFVSGLSHLPGSFIQNNNTQPFMELTVKMEQCLGVILQQFWVSVVVPKVFPVGSVPRRVRQFTNLVFVLLWFILTGPHLLDGYARDGIYCVEVLPFSLVRMLGFGSGRWLRWTKFPLEVWRGPTWWHTGIRIV